MVRGNLARLNRRETLKVVTSAGTVGLTGIAGCLDAGGDGGGNESSTIILGYSGQEGSPQDEGARLLRDTIQEKSDGDIEVNVNCCQQVGGPVEVLESTQQQTLDMGISAVNNITEFSRAWLFTQLPYLWEEHKNMYNFFNEADVMDDVNEKAHEDISNINILGYMGSNGGSLRHLHFTNDSTPKVPSDAQGEEVRVTESPIERTTVNEWGFNATQISWEETISAMREGVVDGIHLHYGWFYDDGVYELANYSVETFTQDSPCAIYVNSGKWESLPSDHTEVIQESLDEVIPQQIEIDLEHGEKRKEDALNENSNLTIHETTDDELKEWMEVTEPVYDQWVGEEGVSEEVVKAALDFQDYEVPGVDL